MSRIYTQQKRPGVKPAAPSYDAPAVHAPSLVSGQSSSDLDALMQAKYRQHFLDNQIPHAEAEADRIAASVSGARTPEEVKSQLGEKMGADFSNVTFHTDSAALKQADAMGARAYTTGSDVYFGSGGFDPGVAAHELVHTVQQGMVGSAMQTTSAPTGGVQMMPRWLSGLFKKKQTVSDEENDSMLQQATGMMQAVIESRPNYAALQEKKEASYKKAEKTMQHLPQLQALFNQQKQQYEDMYQRTGKKSPFQEQYPSPYGLKNGHATLESAQEEFLRLTSALNQREVNLKGLDGKTMLKSANQLQQIVSDFSDLDIRHINNSENADPFHESKIGNYTMMDANSRNREIRISPNYFGKNSLNRGKGRRVKGSFGFHTSNNSYSLSHELGHIVNYHIADKINEQQPDKALYGSYDKKETDSAAAIRALLANSLIKQANTDKKLQKILNKNVKSRNGIKEISGRFGAQRVADALITGEKGYDSKLLNALHKGGYTSKYGSQDAMEMYAEAFADHYQNETKSRRYRNAPNKQKKLANLQKERNILSDTILSDSKEIFNDPRKLAEFMEFFGTAS